MSILSTTHPVVIHTAACAAAEGQRGIVIAWKDLSANQKAKRAKAGKPEYKVPAKRFVSIPPVTLSVTPEILNAALKTCYEDMQDSIIRAKIERAIEESKDRNPTVCIEDADITPEAVAASAALKAVTGRMSKELLGAWFDENLSDELELAIIKLLKLPETLTAEQQANIDAAVTEHKAAIVGLAASRANYDGTLVKQLKRAVKLIAVDMKDDGTPIYDESDKVLTAINEKLDSFAQPSKVSIALGLGE